VRPRVVVTTCGCPKENQGGCIFDHYSFYSFRRSGAEAGGSFNSTQLVGRVSVASDGQLYNKERNIPIENKKL